MAGKSGRTISADPGRAWQRVSGWEWMLLLLFLTVNLFCMMLSPNYQIRNVLREMPKYLAEVFIMLPMAYLLILGEIDISLGSVVCLAATAACLSANAGVPLPLVLAIGLLAGTACGFFNGLVLAKFKELPPMIVTLATQIMFRGLAELMLGSGGSVSLQNTRQFKLLAGKIGMVPYVLAAVAAAAVIFILVLSKTIFGRMLYAIGSNRIAAEYCGIPVQRIRLTVYTIAGLMAGICALFLTSVLYGANTTTGNGFEMDVIAMAVFGGISTAGGKGRLPGAAAAALIIICLRIGLGLINLNPQIILIILGMLLIAAVLLPNLAAGVKGKLKTSK